VSGCSSSSVTLITKNTASKEDKTAQLKRHCLGSLSKIDRRSISFFLSFDLLFPHFFSLALFSLSLPKKQKTASSSSRARASSRRTRGSALSGSATGTSRPTRPLSSSVRFLVIGFFSSSFAPPPPSLSLFSPLSSPFLSFLSFSLLILQTWPRSRDTPRGPSANAWCPRPPSSPAGTFIGGAFRACPPCRWRSRASSWPRKSRSRTSRRGTF